ncbi:hypothetical protein [Ktedonobacter racemifer]|uniref:Uncharacterized protein n=1 Tax=Ktedonobacter racemifer DSM 44963 TaxID=485913 RepID=D6TWL7_KTERA|nr:hypothetical protein [Ktedonobacter racemifer]EFH84600.1 hypothetical protein Krac_5680 [Ktedonobacter racemifer DSM 44963]
MVKTQTLSFPIRVPDGMQAQALRLLDASRLAINQIITTLWPQLMPLLARGPVLPGSRSSATCSSALVTATARSAARWSRRAASCAPRPAASASSRVLST